MKILIAFGTLTGNTEEVSKSLRDFLTEQKHLVTLVDQSDIKISELSQFELIILGASTWGDGELGANPITEDFVERFEKEFEPSKDIKFAIFGLGDSSYEHFCGVVDLLEDTLIKNNCKIIKPSLKLEGLPENNLEIAQEWAKNITSSI